MKVVLAYNVKKDVLPPELSGASIDEYYAECDSFDTIEAIRDVLAQRHQVTLVEADADAYEHFRAAQPDFVFNFAEGLWGAARESQIPAMLEMLRIPYTGSDPLSLALCLDKFRTKEVLAFHSVAAPKAYVVAGASNGLPPGFGYPVMVKPLAEGSSKGVRNTSLVRDAAGMQREVERIRNTIGGPALVEEFLPGREFTVAMLGNEPNLRCLPIIEIRVDLLPAGANPIYSYEAKWEWDVEDAPRDMYECPAAIPAALRERIEKLCRDAWRALGLRDWTRMDVRLDAAGEPKVIEVNAVPGVLPRPDQHSAFPMAARAAGIAFPELIHAVLDAALERHERAAASASCR